MKNMRTNWLRCCRCRVSMSSRCQKVEALELPRQTERPQIFVLVNGTEFAEREELAVVAQLGTVQCELFIRAKNRRGKLGLFDVYEAAKSRLLGYRMQGRENAHLL